MKTLRWVVVLLILILVVLVSGRLWIQTADGFSASAQPTRIEAMMATMMRHLALPRSARALHNPVPASAANLAMARQHFAAHCALCHNNNGDGLTDFGRNLYPKPPDLRGAATQARSDGALFYSIRNGIRLSGMPAWPDDEDDEIWMLVGFIRHLPRQTPAEAAAMKPYNPTTIFPEPLM